MGRLHTTLTAHELCFSRGMSASMCGGYNNSLSSDTPSFSFLLLSILPFESLAGH